jgi:hypothetical protein
MYRRFGFPLLRGALLAQAGSAGRSAGAGVGAGAGTAAAGGGTTAVGGTTAGSGWKAAAVVAYATEVIRAYGVDRVPDVVTTLSKLVELTELGVLTDDEYATARSRLLDAYRLM